MYKRFFTSITFLLSAITMLVSIFVWKYLEAGELFGITKNETLLKVLVFNLRSEGFYHYISAVASIFYHPGLEHLALNLIFLILIGFFGEKKIGFKKFFWLILGGHLFTLAILKLQYSFLGLQEVFHYSGLSAGLVAVLSFFLLREKRYILLAGVIFYFAYEAFRVKGPLSDPHFIALFYGLLFYGVYLIARHKAVNIR